MKETIKSPNKSITELFMRLYSLESHSYRLIMLGVYNIRNQFKWILSQCTFGIRLSEEANFAKQKYDMEALLEGG